MPFNTHTTLILVVLEVGFGLVRLGGIGIFEHPKLLPEIGLAAYQLAYRVN